jgi:pterin-4a-carbinolamine dehydratase
MHEIFISYRRSDSYDETKRLATVLLNEFGNDHVFFDKTSAGPGMAWPNSIKKAVQGARALIVVIGPTWLHSHEEKSGRRRIDIDEDWVRQEILTFLARKEKDDNLLVLPILVKNADMPRHEYLDPQMQALCDFQPIPIYDSGSNLDFTQVRQTLIQRQFRPLAVPPVLTPMTGRLPQQLTREEEHEFLEQYPEWKIIESEKPGTLGDMMRELYRIYEFKDYDAAWRFLQLVDESGIRPYNHHPRWQNMYNRLEVWLATSNIGHKPSQKDVRLAKIIESIWEDFKVKG